MSEYIDELQLHKRFLELANRSFNQNIYTFTDFLGMSEQSVFWKNEKQYRFAGCEIFGGLNNSERVIVRFGDKTSFGYDGIWNIACIYIEPLIIKFADELTHRDFLGALMNLGIERSVLGDIKLQGKCAYLFCQDSIAEYICNSLDKVKHTSVKCSIVELDEISHVFEEKTVEKTIQVASMRVDGVISKTYNISRNDVLELFRTGKIFVNGRLCENNSKQIKEDDTITVRGFGKFVILPEMRETRKGKISIGISAFI